MSKHWQPGDGRRWIAADESARTRKGWPKGATAGLVLVAVSCAGLAVLLYQLAGPRDVFAP